MTNAPVVGELDDVPFVITHCPANVLVLFVLIVLQYIFPPTPRPPEMMTAPLFVFDEFVLFVKLHTPFAVIEETEIDANTIDPDTLKFPPIDAFPLVVMLLALIELQFNDPPIPTPPDTTNAPFVVDVLVVEFVIVQIPLAENVPVETVVAVIDENDIAPATVKLPPIVALFVVFIDEQFIAAQLVVPPIPTPPATINAPFVLFVLAVLLVIDVFPENVAEPDENVLQFIAPATPRPPADNTSAPVVAFVDDVLFVIVTAFEKLADPAVIALQTIPSKVPVPEVFKFPAIVQLPDNAKLLQLISPVETELEKIAPLAPIPPDTTNAPVLVLVDAVVFPITMPLAAVYVSNALLVNVRDAEKNGTRPVVPDPPINNAALPFNFCNAVRIVSDAVNVPELDV
jgi:hypothetical protein